jgi:hypothetical protein
MKRAISPDRKKLLQVLITLATFGYWNSNEADIPALHNK